MQTKDKKDRSLCGHFLGLRLLLASFDGGCKDLGSE